MKIRKQNRLMNRCIKSTKSGWTHLLILICFFFSFFFLLISRQFGETINFKVSISRTNHGWILSVHCARTSVEICTILQQRACLVYYSSAWKYYVFLSVWIQFLFFLFVRYSRLSNIRTYHRIQTNNWIVWWKQCIQHLKH